ncbi:hypothetical protein MTO96_043572 [Rhipicephalus appendiculatus]
MFSTKPFPGYTCISDLEHAGKCLKYVEPEAHEDDVIIMSHTSGTTGTSKIMEVQQERFLRQMCGREVLEILTPDDVPIGGGNVSFFFFFSFVFNVLSAGATIVLLKSVNMPYLFEACNRHKVNLINATPQILLKIAEAAKASGTTLPTVKKLRTQGIFLPERIAAEVVSVFAPDELRDCYGMTEVSGFLAVPPKGGTTARKRRIPRLRYKDERERWSFTRRTRWFEETVPLLGEKFFKRAFRVTPATFRYIVETVRPLLERQNTNMREAIALDKRVAIGLYRLCSSAEERSIAELFAVGRSTVNEAYRELCEAVIHTMEARWVNMPTVSSMAEHIREFTAVLGFPQAIGALDGCHFPVSPPKENATDYRNYKGWYSMILLALVDHKYMFRYINVGSPGRCHDSYVYQRSQLAGAVQGPLFRQPLLTISGTAVPPLILCDQAFPLTGNLLKPFSHRAQLSNEQRLFNYNLSKARRIVENAFGRLKARFRFIMKRMECEIDNCRLAIRACCVLNNVCEHFGDTVLQHWLAEVQNNDKELQQPDHSTDAEEGTGCDVREALVRHFQRSSAGSA